MWTFLLIVVFAVLVFLASTGTDGIKDTRRQIERRGFYGRDMDDLLQAERELQEKYNKNSGAATRKTKPEGGTNANTKKQ